MDQRQNSEGLFRTAQTEKPRQSPRLKLLPVTAPARSAKAIAVSDCGPACVSFAVGWNM
ncbi:hypothetical protein SPAB_02247 [Salmonella enterica subsp. enterica serovar Paratyphi B str. SPB7]|uniref:Uncharacterized protein n=1 Tax=Salmonella paratyphi B (strain ATCC BAA-1250 / SPB7) TaxID=1016998 RepID=A0A6C6Z1U0_SALPB|nr:hypothetical protein SPAB_02247 [Salmonella enterica subsp. enterica serovar Paratyphi B str. SPB7]